MLHDPTSVNEGLNSLLIAAHHSSALADTTVYFYLVCSSMYLIARIAFANPMCSGSSISL